MKNTAKLISVLLTIGLIGSAAVIPAGAEDRSTDIRVVVENNTLSVEDGADWSGTLLDTWVTVDTDATFVSVLEKAFQENSITEEGLDMGYITSVNGLSGEDGGAMGGWMIMLDHWVTDEAVSSYTVSNGKLAAGDEIRLSYSCAWGADIGYDWSGSDTSLSALDLTGCELTPEFSPDCYEYIAKPDPDSDCITVDPRTVNSAYRTKVYLNEYTPAIAGSDIKFGSPIDPDDCSVIIIGVANPAWMQSNYNNAEESIYKIFIEEFTEEPDTQVQQAESFITAIGTVSASSGEAIKKARAVYELLSDEQKAQVSNYSVLVEAENIFAELVKDKPEVTLDELRNACKQLAPENPASGNEWDIINLSRLELITDTQKQHYAESMEELIKNTGSNRLSATRSTVNSGAVTALTAAGINASDFYGHDLFEPLSDVEYVEKQGINGAVYALIAGNLHSYKYSDAGTEDKLISILLSSQQQDGGWTIDTWTGIDDGSDGDMTAMVLQALAPYYKSAGASREDVREAVDRALDFLSQNQNDSGQFASYGSYDCESSAQVMTALCSLGIDPENDERFVKNGYSVYDGLVSFCRDDRTFSHLIGGESNAMSTTQAYTAVAALYRFKNDKTSLFDMTDLELITLSEPVQEPSGETVPSSEPSDKPDVQPSESSSAADTSRIIPNTPDTVKTGDSPVLFTVLLMSQLLSSAVVIAAVKAKTKREK